MAEQKAAPLRPGDAMAVVAASSASQMPNGCIRG